MSAYLLMKILEAFPRRYERGIRFLGGKKLGERYDRLISYVKRGDRVLDIGCGTGELSLKAARKGGKVRGMDVNASLLEEARRKAERESLSSRVEFLEMGVAELDKMKAASYDEVVSGLCFSELNNREFSFALNQIRRILKPGGLLLVADIAAPENPFKKWVNGFFAFWMRGVSMILAGSSPKPLDNFPQRMEKLGIKTYDMQKNRMENFMIWVGKKLSK